MPERSSKKRDVNELAASIVAKATGDEPEPEPEAEEATDEPELTADGKNAAAVALGRLGGKKGGPARAKKLSKKRRIEIASKAAKKRWGDSKGK